MAEPKEENKDNESGRPRCRPCGGLRCAEVPEMRKTYAKAGREARRKRRQRVLELLRLARLQRDKKHWVVGAAGAAPWGPDFRDIGVSGFREIPNAAAKAARKLKRNPESGGEAAGRKPEMLCERDAAGAAFHELLETVLDRRLLGERTALAWLDDLAVDGASGHGRQWPCRVQCFLGDVGL